MVKTKRNIRKANVCVIGGAGFLGSTLVDYLVEVRKCNVIVLDNLVTGQKKWVHPKATFIWFDITNSENRLRDLFEHYKIEYVFNYAAEPYIPVSFARPLHVFDINARAALLVLNAAQAAGVKGILQVSSAEIYGAHKANKKIKEDEAVIPHSSYGVSKAAVDAFVQVRFKEAGTPAIAMRQFNCVGPRETHPYVIPEIIKQLAPQSGKDTATIRLGNNSFRDFQFSRDAVAMAVELLEKGKFGEVYNMGSEGGIKIYPLAQLIGKLMGFKSVWIIKDKKRVRPWEIWHLQSDNTKLFKIIKARPLATLEEALRITIGYFEENAGKWDF